MQCMPDGHGLSTAPGTTQTTQQRPRGLRADSGHIQTHLKAEFSHSPLRTATARSSGGSGVARQGSAGAVLARSPARGSAAPAPCRAAARPAAEMGPPLHAAALPGCTRATRGHHSLQEAEQRSRESSQGKGPGKVQRGASLAVFAVNAAHPVPQHRTAGVRCALRPPLCHTTAEHHSPPPSRFCGTGKGLSLTEYNAL